ncbi:efflux RND transporter periplasmic adaptor subunit [Dongia soli]|uniref:Efflux RND transporter periplasmic adaptor subunit n=1 Tax=Dongia soli TaxID=600628 RepID=A0ABU5EG29_9PROT|nr:efflux RND transporter periplasmic adaptor subunit [Dongia soli]MDY0884959.1 efflux RND transporter periplasmic adaptor subunit [Dongia soli]
MRRILVLLAALATAACGEKATDNAEAARPARVVRVADANLLAGRALPGQARSAREAMLAFRVPGRILERRVRVGDQVKEGDVVATLDPAPYQVELDRVASSLQRARAAYANAASQLDRDRQLLAKGVIAKARFEVSDTTAKQALAEVKSVEAAQERAKLDLSYTQLRAPFDGVVSAAFAEAFAEVNPSQSVIRLIDPAEIEMVVNVPESMISYVPYMVDLKVTFDAVPGIEIPAEVSEIGREPSETTRTYLVKLLLTPPPGVIVVPGMAGQARGRPGPEIAKELQGVLIPLSATFSPDDATRSFVWVVNEGAKTVHRQPVTLGEPVVGGVSVTEGLASGNLIVTAGVHSLREGQAIRVSEP